ncbi:MAG: hypothetical protein Q8P34_09770 [Bacteroidota bacterium]|nr:hypothetical protein [Bacteroidota bacterium]
MGAGTDTLPYRHVSDHDYISTGDYIRNMKMLINFVRATKAPSEVKKSVVWH